MKTHVASNWERALLTCGKCSRKVGGGFGDAGRTPLAKALRAELGVGKGRKARIGVVEVKCLGVCPKRAVAVVDSADTRRWHLIRPGEPIAAVARTLLGDAAHSEPAVQVAALAVEVVETTVVLPVPDQPPSTGGVA